MLAEKLDQDLKDALRAGDEVRKSVLRLLRAGIRNVEKTKGVAIDDAGVLVVLGKEAKEHRDSLEEFTKAKRQDLIDRTQLELDILLAYLPQQLSKEEITAAVREIMTQTGATGAADKGKLMGAVMAQLRGKAEGRDINEVVSGLLATPQ
ncbi:MAG: GatB/YqeY domain-containing protein [Dehalococcoidia bacterium]|nr:GatB/YqeY domain-containing protein [Dehalococcoidia bacterium]